MSLQWNRVVDDLHDALAYNYSLEKLWRDVENVRMRDGLIMFELNGRTIAVEISEVTEKWDMSIKEAFSTKVG